MIQGKNGLLLHYGLTLGVIITDNGRDIIPVDGTLSSVLDHLLCVEREVAQDKDIHKLFGCDEWLGWLIRVLEGAR